MKNILIVCADKTLRKDISKTLGDKLGLLYFDADDMLDFLILNNSDVKISNAGQKLRDMQLEVINRMLKFEDKVICISHDTFVANDNFKSIVGMHTIFISLSKAYFVARNKATQQYSLQQELSILDNINKLVSANCDITIEKESKSIETICQEIIMYLEQKKSR